MAICSQQCVVCGKWFTPFPNPNEAGRPGAGLLTKDGPMCFPCLDKIEEGK